MMKSIIKKFTDYQTKKRSDVCMRKIMSSDALKLERFFSKHHKDEMRLVGLNKYIDEKIKEIRTVKSFLRALPPEAVLLTHEEIMDLRDYRQMQIATSVEDIYEATHLLATRIFDHAPAVDVLVNRICNRPIDGEKNHFAILTIALNSIINSSEEDKIGNPPPIQLNDKQREKLEKRIKYIESL